MIYYGNVVRFKQKPKELYVVKDSTYVGKHLDKIVLIPFDHCNSSTHISRKNPLTKWDFVHEECRKGECDCGYHECPEKKVPSPTYNIDEVEYVAEHVTGFIMRKMKAVVFDD